MKTEEIDEAMKSAKANTGLLDMNRLEMIDLDPPSSEIVWTGTVDEFTAANVDGPMSDEEIEFLVNHGYVVVGGGAAPMFCIRYAKKENAK